MDEIVMFNLSIFNFGFCESINLKIKTEISKGVFRLVENRSTQT